MAKQPQTPNSSDSAGSPAKPDYSLKHPNYVSVIESPDGVPSHYLFGRNHIRLADREEFMIVGFDTEYVTPKEPVTNEDIRNGAARYEVLSYQFHAKTIDGHEWKGIVLPQELERMSFSELIVYVFGKGISDLNVANLPNQIYLVAHYNRADVTAFDDRDKLIKRLNNIRKSLVTRGTPIKIDISFPLDPAPEDKGEYFLKVHLRDTFLLAPTGSRSLAEIGNLVGCPKIALSEDPSKEKYYKENMNVLLRDDWPLFQRYALNDAEICVRYFEYLSNKYCELRGKRAVPVALSSMGVRLLIDGWNRTGIDPISTVGKETISESVWVAEKQNFQTRKRNIYLEEISWHLDFATECYHGGRNEQFWFGPSFEDDWSDYDLTGAYPTAMALIGLPAWHEIKPCSDPSEFTVDKLGFACVDFEFPEGTRYPTLPIRTANGIIFPLKGRSYCSTPEIEVAQKLGCEIDLRHGVIIPQDTETKIFQDFLIDSIAKRNAAETDLERQFWKELTNSCYGKTAQGLRRKRVFSVQKERNEQLKESQITNPYFAAYITSFVRAVLGEIINGLPENKTVFSVTTDGFITNATDQEIETASKGTLASKYSDSRLTLAGSGEMLKKKHSVRRVLGWKTRGQATLAPGKEEGIPQLLLAKSGIQPPPFYNLPTEQNDFIVNLFLERTGDDIVTVDTQTTIRDMVLHHADLVRKATTRRLNMEYDFKRCPASAVECDIKFNGNQYRHLAFTTRPWESIEEFKSVRGLFDDYIQENYRRCLKGIDDYKKLADYFDTRHALPVAQQKYMRSTSDADLLRLKRDLSSAFRQGNAGLGQYKNMTANGFCEVLKRSGFDKYNIPCKRHTIENANANRSPFKPQSTPQTERVIEVITAVKAELPNLEMGEILSTHKNKQTLTKALKTSDQFTSRLLEA